MQHPTSDRMADTTRSVLPNEEETRAEKFTSSPGRFQRTNRVSKRLRQVLAVAAAGGALIASSQMAIAATHMLEGAKATPQSVNDDNAEVKTKEDFKVTVAAPNSGDALFIRGAGRITYDDGGKKNELKTSDGIGLYIISTGDHGEAPGTVTPGAITVNSSGDITGQDGIFAENYGTGSTTIAANGAVTGTEWAGIFAYNKGKDLTITAEAEVKGGNNGIYALNEGTGSTTITANGTVTGTEETGIYARNAGKDLTIAAAAVSGGEYGIYAENYGEGNTTITATGTVTGTEEAGIYAENNGKNLTITAAAVSGGYDGIYVYNSGEGNTTITATGTVTGAEGDGIYAYNSSYAKDLTITAAAVSGGYDGIYVDNYGEGNTTITATGTVTGAEGAGIFAWNEGKDLKITAAAVSGGEYGIHAENWGTGDTIITTSGEVQGSEAGIAVQGEKKVSITINGNSGSTVRNSSGSTLDDAIRIGDFAEGNGYGEPLATLEQTEAPVPSSTITNNGTILGNVQTTGAQNNTFTNNSIWNNAGGISEFGGAADIFNNHGTFRAANEPTGSGEPAVTHIRELLASRR